MELSPRSGRSIQESTGTSSSELQPFINLNDGRSLQHEVTAYSQLRDLIDCRMHQILIRTEAVNIQNTLNESSGMRLQQVKHCTRMNRAGLRTCVQEKEDREKECIVLEFAANAMKDQLEPFETVHRLQTEQMAGLSDQLGSLQRENLSIGMELHRAEQEAAVLGKVIENLQMYLTEGSDSHVPIERRSISPASESEHSTSASAEMRNILDIMGCELEPK